MTSAASSSPGGGLAKRTWPGLWTNTCCGHPAPGEPITDALRRRLRFELGLEVDDLTCVLPDSLYRGGAPLTVQTVEGLMKTRMDHVVLIDFEDSITGLMS